MIKPYKIAAINITNAEFFTAGLDKCFFDVGIKVSSNPINPKPISTELLLKLLALPVWYLRLIKPIASKA